MFFVVLLFLSEGVTVTFWSPKKEWDNRKEPIVERLGELKAHNGTCEEVHGTKNLSDSSFQDAFFFVVVYVARIIVDPITKEKKLKE